MSHANRGISLNEELDFENKTMPDGFTTQEKGRRKNKRRNAPIETEALVFTPSYQRQKKKRKNGTTPPADPVKKSHKRFLTALDRTRSTSRISRMIPLNHRMRILNLPK
jgi:hypothetical protein